jgi:hypothetical protein
MRFIHYLAALVGGAVVLAGCNMQPSEKLFPVSGTITADGKAVPAGNVTFYPDTSKGNETLHQPTGVIDSEGHYELFVPGGKRGAPQGWYKIVVYAVDDPQPGKPNKYFVDKQYTDLTTTPLKIEVIENPEAERYDLKLKR